MSKIPPHTDREVPFVPADPGPGWEALPIPGLMLDAQGRVAALNDAAESWLNLSRRSALGMLLEDNGLSARLRFSPPLSTLIGPVMDGHDGVSRPDIGVEIGDRAGGHDVRRALVHISPRPDGPGVVALILPASAMQRLGVGETARRAARQAIGMAEMLAHEIKNPLAGIQGAAQLLGMNASDGDRELTDMIVAETRRIVTLLDQVERFGDTTAPQLAPVNLHDVLERARRSMELNIASGITFETDYDPSLPMALADADQLTQVFLNLLANAADALSGRPDPIIRLRSFYDGALRLSPSEDAPDGRHLPLQIEIEDNGPGIPDNFAAGEIFEPFVSGRENGTGLGLALVSKIVTDHGGWLRVESRPGRTVFCISLAKAGG